MGNKVAWCLLLAGFSTFSAYAQEPAFEVASLKPSPPPEGDLYTANLGKILHGELTMTNVTLSDCLRLAYGITNDAQIDATAGSLGWVKDKSIRFDVIAKAPAGTPDDRIPLMLRALLNERFRLTLHHEDRNLAWLALTVAKNGPKLHEAQEGSDPSGNRNSLDRIISNHMSMPLMATLLSRFLRQTVLDRTDLKGFYEVHLIWAPENMQPTAVEPPDSSTAPSIFTAVQSQLGLRLESRKEPLDVLVIDAAMSMPLGN